MIHKVIVCLVLFIMGLNSLIRADVLSHGRACHDDLKANLPAIDFPLEFDSLIILLGKPNKFIFEIQQPDLKGRNIERPKECDLFVPKLEDLLQSLDSCQLAMEDDLFEQLKPFTENGSDIDVYLGAGHLCDLLE